MGGRRASRSRDRDQRHSGHRPWERGYSGLPESAGACVYTSSLATPLHPPTTTSQEGSGVIPSCCSTCNGCLKRINERSCITALLLNPLIANDPQCKEGHNAFQDHEECRGRMRMCGYVG